MVEDGEAHGERKPLEGLAVRAESEAAGQGDETGAAPVAGGLREQGRDAVGLHVEALEGERGHPVGDMQRSRARYLVGAWHLHRRTAQEVVTAAFELRRAGHHELRYDFAGGAPPYGAVVACDYMEYDRVIGRVGGVAVAVPV